MKTTENIKSHNPSQPPPKPGADGLGTESVSGVIDHIVYRSDETGFTVCILKPPKGGADMVVVGSCAAMWPGETLSAEGHWSRHKVHGYQFNASRITCIEPNSTAGIRKYLASGLIKGVGEVLAERLVKKFGAATLRVIDKESALLESVEGIGRKKREQIKNAWNEQKAVREVMIFLHTYGVTTSQANRIHRAYGDNAIARIKENPYRLANDIWGIGFKTADKIALKLGIPEQSIVRARAGVVYALQTSSNEGHCYNPRDELLALAEQLLTIDRGILEEALDIELAGNALVQEGDNIYLASLHRAELGVASNIRRLQQAGREVADIDLNSAISWAERRMKLDFAPSQAEALKMTFSRKVSIITGGPGVGKTTIIRALVDIFAVKKATICMAAPTGRAAKRMEEATGRQASTLHRLLKFVPAAGKFTFDSGHPLNGDVFILDEVSMIDLPLMNAFLRALPDRARLIIVGDADQLPSVGPGNVLRDLLASGRVPAVKLDTVFRQQERSWIVHNAHLVNTGRFFELPAENQPSDFYFIEEDEPDRVIERAVELIANRIPRRFGLNPMKDVQLLTPMRRFQLGAENLNAVLQEALNPGGLCVSRFGRNYRTGDRVMQLRNNYDKDVFNGDIGAICEIEPDQQGLKVDFDGRKVEYGLSELDELSLAYACSIHKAQGHEHPAVVILLTTQHYRMLQRNLLYTAMTRGRKLVCLIGSKKAVAIGIRNNHTIKRKTGLAQRLASE